MKRYLLLICCLGLISGSCKYLPATKAVVNYDNAFLNHALNNRSDYYYIDFKAANKISSTLPIGIFDSGTGGLTVLNALANFDRYNNSSHMPLECGDGISDFRAEEFIYFGDQANMPYGHYAEVNKTGFLKELILRDALFLAGNKYYKSPDDKRYQTGKKSVKLIVIACNTATAYGRADIESMLSAAGSRIRVIGVIDAGVRGALDTFKENEDGTVAVMATAGTVASDGYLNTFVSLKSSTGHKGKLDFFQYAGQGIAEAIDEEPNYLNRNAMKPRIDYKGPSFFSENLKIRKEQMGIYNFDTTGNSLLVDFRDGQCHELQLNSPENYIKYHLVSMVDDLRSRENIKPLKTLILGCTHYPYLSGFIKTTLRELYNVKVDNKYIYRSVLPDSVILIDPAINTAKEVYDYLLENDLFNKKGDINRSEFFISVPDKLNSAIITDSLNWFTYDYKYNRNENHFYDTRQVPVSRLNTNDEIIARIKEQLPSVYELIIKFQRENKRTLFLKPAERL